MFQSRRRFLGRSLSFGLPLLSLPGCGGTTSPQTGTPQAGTSPTLPESDLERSSDLSTNVQGRPRHGSEKQPWDTKPDAIRDKVIDITAEQLEIDQRNIASPEVAFVEDLEADSLDLVELIMEFEDEFDIRIADDDIEKFRTVDAAVEYIRLALRESQHQGSAVDE